jgi:hypothetical protein
LNYIYIKYFFKTGVLGPPVWEPGPKILEDPAGAPKTNLPVPCRPPFWGAGGDALRAIGTSTRGLLAPLHKGMDTSSCSKAIHILILNG